jgi:uncharacterized protein (DUF1501 family)
MMDRRSFLRRTLAGVACSAAAHPLMTTVTLAETGGLAPLGENRLIVIILRGAMDGLDAVQPQGDPLFAEYRPTLGVDTGALALDGMFGLHPHLAGLKPLWDKGELGFVHATSTPYRDKRSHFDGQDLLEAGTGSDILLGGQKRDGWMNRMLQVVPGMRAETAYAIGQEASPMLAGAAPARHWSPEMRLELSPQSKLLLEHLYHEDALFRDSAMEAMEIADTAAGMGLGTEPVTGTPKERQLAGVDQLVDFAAARLREATRIAAFSLSGWDTHRNQRGSIQGSMMRLERLILRLNDQLGAEVWGKTVLLTMTEFGRTARENGSHGTDHGTGGMMIAAGGAVRGGKVLGKWPGLAEADLYDRRDLMPTSDVRDWAAWAMRGLYGFDTGLLEKTVFPGLIMGEDPGLIL